jgi:hypothetical protein
MGEIPCFGEFSVVDAMKVNVAEVPLQFSCCVEKLKIS